MRWQLLRLLSMMALAVFVVIVSVNTLYEQYSDDSLRYTVSASQLATALQRGETPIAQRLSLSSAHFPEDLLARLQAGEVIGLNSDSEVTFYHLTDTGLLQIGPFPERPPESVAQWRLLFLGGMLLVLLLLIYPMFRDLRNLQNQAIEFSKKPFRMSEAASPTSAIYPLAETFRRVSNMVIDYCQMNQDLARTIAHEIRTPLSRINFQLALSGDANDGTGTIAKSVSDIESLVDKYLNFSRVELQEEFIRRKQIELEDFFAELEEDLGNSCPELHISFYFQDENAWMEPDSLAIAVQNLVTNARKYANDSVEVRFKVEGARCVLTVEDNGPGLASEGIELTDAFTRAATDEQGYGLGLYIVKKVMMWHDGELTLDRSPTLNGTRATLSWPNAA